MKDDIGLIGTKTYNPKEMTSEQLRDSKIFQYIRPKEFILNNPNKVFNQIQGGLFAINRNMYEQIGGFSYELPHNHTDVEYSLYSLSKGWKHEYLEDNISVWNKSKPSVYSRINSSSRAFHPSSYSDLNLIDDLIQGNKWICNICETVHSASNISDNCKSCGSSDIERLIWKQLVNSNLLFRRLPALIIGDMGTLKDKLSYHFQGPKLPPLSDSLYLDSNFALPNPSARFSVMVFMDPIEMLLKTRSNVYNEFKRVCSANLRIISFSDGSMPIHSLTSELKDFVGSEISQIVKFDRICCYVNRIHTTITVNSSDL